MGFQFALITRSAISEVGRLTSHEILLLLSSCLKSRKNHHLASTFFKNGSKFLVPKQPRLGITFHFKESGSDVGESGGSVKGISLKKAEKWATW